MQVSITYEVAPDHLVEVLAYVRPGHPGTRWEPSEKAQVQVISVTDLTTGEPAGDIFDLGQEDEIEELLVEEANYQDADNDALSCGA
jgi:hypothetical protein